MEDVAIVQGLDVMPENTVDLLLIISQFFAFVMDAIGKVMSLAGENIVWLGILVGLTWAVDNFILRKFGFPSGWIRYVFAFLIVMFFYGFWVGIIRGFMG